MSNTSESVVERMNMAVDEERRTDLVVQRLNMVVDNERISWSRRERRRQDVYIPSTTSSAIQTT